MNENQNWVKETLDKRADALDAQSRSQLNQFRQEMLTSKASSRSWFQNPWYAGGAVFASVFAIVIALAVKPNSAVISNTFLDDIELLASNDDPDFYDDMAFYRWLDEEYPEGEQSVQ